MTTLDSITLAVAMANAYGALCRLFPISWRTHRPSIVMLYVLMASVSILSGAKAGQGQADFELFISAATIGVYLLATFRAWRHGPPAYCHRTPPQGHEVPQQR